MRISDWSSDVCSSDLGEHSRDRHSRPARRARPRHGPQTVWIGLRSRSDRGHLAASATRMLRATAPGSDRSRQTRSEEHTSELQSLMRISYAVFCLKKKTKTTQKKYQTRQIQKQT